MKKIGVIVPVYNSEKTILRLLDSILCQKYLKYEVIIVNDGSTDNSRELIETFINDNQCGEQFKVFNVTNGGVSKARNIGLQKVKCDYVIFMDSDDWINADYFENIIKDMEGYDLIVYAYNNYCKNNFTEVSISNQTFHNKKEFYEILCSSHLFNSLWNKVFIYEYMSKLRFNENISYGEDCELVIKYLNLAKKFRYVDKIFYNYDLSTGGLGFKNWENSFAIKCNGLKEIEKFYDINGYEKKYINKGFIKAFVIDISNYISKGNIKKNELNAYRKKCYQIYDIRKIEINGIYHVLKTIYTSEWIIVIKLCSKTIQYLKEKKQNKMKF